EMTAAVEGLKAAVEQGAGEIVVISDSEYLVKGMTGWVKGWMKNGWKTSTGSPVKNKALWQELHRLTQGHTVTWTWTRGHVGHKENEECDSLAVAAAKQAAKGR
ncbi:MAG TPA: ribonuclease H, partial [Chloroflexota bacterium]|nr:ribonuclease H [Chloroflexota bacterium]